MAHQHVSRRATGAVRWLGVLALLLGIAAMHAGVFSVATHDMTHSMSMAAPPTVLHDSPAMGGHPAPIHVQHACEAFTLAAAGFVIGLILLGWLNRPPDADRPPDPGSRRAHRERSPPWTVPSLTQLSILRI